MWQVMGQMALDIARERAQEAQQEHLAAQARAAHQAEDRAHGVVRPSRLRATAASALRAVSGVFGSVADAACEAASRVERRTA
jgi:hypothetical protein